MVNFSILVFMTCIMGFVVCQHHQGMGGHRGGGGEAGAGGGGLGHKLFGGGGPGGHHQGRLGKMMNKRKHKKPHQPKDKYKPHPNIVQSDIGEKLPDEHVKKLVAKSASAIKDRSVLEGSNEQDITDLKEALVEALAFIKLSDGESEYYLIKVIVGNEYIYHVKIGVKVVGGGELDYDSATVMTVVEKKEVDKLDKSEL